MVSTRYYGCAGFLLEKKKGVIMLELNLNSFIEIRSDHRAIFHLYWITPAPKRASFQA